MQPIIIGIAGGSGSGKTTLANRIIEKLTSDIVLLVQHDVYYYDLSLMPDPNPANINYDHPNSLETKLCVDHLHKLQHGERVQQPLYDFSTHKRRRETRPLEPKPIILVEGILVLVEESLRTELDLKVFVDAEPDIRLLRRLERDITVRGRTVQSVRDQYYATVRPMYEKFIAPSKQYADIIIPHGGENTVAQDVLIGTLKHRLASTQ